MNHETEEEKEEKNDIEAKKQKNNSYQKSISIAIIFAVVVIGAYFFLLKKERTSLPPAGNISQQQNNKEGNAHKSSNNDNQKNQIANQTNKENPTAENTDSSDSPFGIHDPLVPNVDSIQDIKTLGAGWVRYMGANGISWGLIETQKNQFRWEHLDRLYLETQQKGIHINTVVAVYQPLDQGKDGFGRIPKDMDWFLNFLERAVERYDGDGISDAKGSPVVEVWEIENEPDHAFHAGDFGWKDSPENYAKLLKKSYLAIKKANQNAKVAFAGFSDPIGIKNYFFPTLDELEKIKDSKNAIYFDITGFHWSGQFQGNYQKEILPNETYQIADVIEEIKLEMRKRGYPETPVWIGEMSYSDGKPEDLPFLEAPRTEKEQAEELVKRYVYSLASGAEKIFWVTLTEWSNFGGKGKNRYFDQVGLIHNQKNDGKSHKKLAYYSYQKLAEFFSKIKTENIKSIQEKNGAYLFQVIQNNGSSFFIAWNDGEREIEIMLPLENPNAQQLRITHLIPAFESGEKIDASRTTSLYTVETQEIQKDSVASVLLKSHDPIIISLSS